MNAADDVHSAQPDSAVAAAAAAAADTAAAVDTAADAEQLNAR